MLEVEMIPVRVLGVHESVMELVTLESLGNGDYTCERAKIERERNRTEISELKFSTTTILCLQLKF